jgi:hypothetical protein
MTSKEMIVDLVHGCQERFFKWSRKAWEAEQAGDLEKAKEYKRNEDLCLKEIRQYWAAGAAQVVEEVNRLNK